MPEMDGFELLVHLNAHFPNIPAVVMTAFGTPEIETNLKENGMLRLLEKPVDFDELTQAILKYHKISVSVLHQEPAMSFPKLLRRIDGTV